MDHLAPEALLWQTGYLTFHGARRTGARTEYTLGYPNLEVQTSLNDALLTKPAEWGGELASAWPQCLAPVPAPGACLVLALRSE